MHEQHRAVRRGAESSSFVVVGSSERSGVAQSERVILASRREVDAENLVCEGVVCVLADVRLASDNDESSKRIARGGCSARSAQRRLRNERQVVETEEEDFVGVSTDTNLLVRRLVDVARSKNAGLSNGNSVKCERIRGNFHDGVTTELATVNECAGAVQTAGRQTEEVCIRER